MSYADSSRHLRLLFSFPSLRIILLVNLMMETLVSLAMLSLFPFFKTFPQTLVVFFTPSVFSALIHRVFFNKDKVFTLRRFFALQLVQEALYAFLVIAAALTSVLLPIEPSLAIPFATGFGIAASSFISFLVITGFSSRSMLSILIVSLLNMVLQSFRWIVVGIILFENLTEVLTVILLSFSTGLLLLTALSLKRVRGKTSPLTVFQAYLDYYFNGDEEPLERFFEEASRENSLRLSIVNFITVGKPATSIIGLNIHFGPFGTLGSSTLPSSLVEKMEGESGRRIILLRSLSDHSFNLPSKREVEKVGSMIMACLNSARRLEDSPVGFSQKEAEGYCVTAARLGPYCIVFLSCPGHSVEDLPPEWLSRLSSVVEKKGLIPLLICDAHNSIDPSSWKVSNPDEKIFVSLLEKAVSDLEENPGETLKIGFHRITPKGLPGEEVGPGGVSSLVFNVDGENHAIIVIDGNNMVIGVRSILSESLRRRFNVSTLEIVTTDTHVLTGLKEAEKGYFPVGFKTSIESLLEACGEALSRALKEASPCGLEVYVDDAKQVRVTGDIFRELERIVEYSEKTITLLMMLLFLLTGFLLYAL
ncbi:MAG: DUF2070 family protein [Thermoproteota archaeon]